MGEFVNLLEELIRSIVLDMQNDDVSYSIDVHNVKRRLVELLEPR